MNSMLTTVRAANLTVTGVSVGGIYTGLHVPELDVILDVGIAPRSFVGASNLLISHGHADHVGALCTLLGIRGLSGAPAPRTFLPTEIAGDVSDAMAAYSRTQRRSLPVEYVGMAPGQEEALGADLHVRSFRTLHSVPSLGYVLFRRVQKLRPAFTALGPEEIRRRRLAGEVLFDIVERPVLGYATDTLVDVVDREPALRSAKVVILEATFLDERKERVQARDKCHIHLDEIIERADSFECESLVLMHFSQLYTPREVHEIVARRCPRQLKERIVVFAPERGSWPG